MKLRDLSSSESLIITAEPRPNFMPIYFLRHKSIGKLTLELPSENHLPLHQKFIEKIFEIRKNSRLPSIFLLNSWSRPPDGERKKIKTKTRNAREEEPERPMNKNQKEDEPKQTDEPPHTSSSRRIMRSAEDFMPWVSFVHVGNTRPVGENVCSARVVSFSLARGSRFSEVSKESYRRSGMDGRE